jgi:hypothetical protein
MASARVQRITHVIALMGVWITADTNRTESTHCCLNVLDRISMGENLL